MPENELVDYACGIISGNGPIGIKGGFEVLA
jgi:hypothetical protein